MVKPFSPTELDELTINDADRQVSLAGKPIELTPTEYKMLTELLLNADVLITYDLLLGRVWGEQSEGDLRPMRTIVGKLGRQLGDDADQPKDVFAEPRVGYRMPRPDEPDEPDEAAEPVNEETPEQVDRPNPVKDEGSPAEDAEAPDPPRESG